MDRKSTVAWMWMTSIIPVIPWEDIGFSKLHIDSESVSLVISHPGCWVRTQALFAVWLAHPCLIDRWCSQGSWLSSLCFGYFEAEGLIPSGDTCLFLLMEQSRFSLCIFWLIFWSSASQKNKPHVSLVIQGLDGPLHLSKQPLMALHLRLHFSLQEEGQKIPFWTQT